MRRGSKQRIGYAWALGGLLVAVLFSGCLTMDDNDTGTPGGGGDPGMDASALAFRSHPELGEILVDPEGRTLYVFTNDEPGVSNCYEQCAVNWPPFLVDEVPGAPQVVAGDLSLVARNDGSMLAYQARPLYH